MSLNFDAQAYSSALTLSTAVNLISNVTKKVIGNDASTTINGEKVNDTMVETIAANRIVSALSKTK